MSLQIITTIGDLVATLPPDEYFIRETDEEGPFLYPVEHAIKTLPKDDPHWRTVIRVVWNDDYTAAVSAKAIPDPNEEPDRAAVVFLHQSMIFSK